MHQLLIRSKLVQRVRRAECLAVLAYQAKVSHLANMLVRMQCELV